MRDDVPSHGHKPETIYLRDYKAPDFDIRKTELVFHLELDETKVHARLTMLPKTKGADLRLDGVGLRLLSIMIDGEPVTFEHITIDDECLIVDADALPNREFVLETEVEIDPQANTSLDGLYVSKGMFCTQCEAEGFRKITYYLDRPDVMSEFFVTIHSTLPVRLSNGNLIEEGDGVSKWHDPWPKPAYLFALVAGQLVHIEDEFVTKSGRKVDLRIYTRKGDEKRAHFAMDALKRSMAWDENAYAREYDLDLFMIVAVDDFNMGAMENKGLNIFNSQLVLASPDTATDVTYERIEKVIAHEYFHNWTGNRITCRDWFQLSLKEGLTVFRDQEFSAHERDAAVCRIDDVIQLRAAQFPEDAGPLQHPVRPEEYAEISNFYTPTVYEKGAEVIRMLHTLLGEQAYQKGVQLYFDRHDGQAVTIEEWLASFEDACDEDLSKFKRWYQQSGTPILHVEESFEDGRYRLQFEQSYPEGYHQGARKPVTIPIRYGLLGTDGQELDKGVITFEDESLTFERELPEKPVASLLRQFSAPVILHFQRPRSDHLHIISYDSDTFARWESVQKLWLDAIDETANGNEPDIRDFGAALLKAASDETLAPAYRAHLLSQPRDADFQSLIKARGALYDPLAYLAAREAVYKTLSKQLSALEPLPAPKSFKPDAEGAGIRAYNNAILSLVSARDGGKAARAAYENAKNMTERRHALMLLVKRGKAKAQLKDFLLRYQGDFLVMNDWYAVQAANTPAEKILATIDELSRRDDWNIRNPNQVRALLGNFVMGNIGGFHGNDGAGYAKLIDFLIELDPINPQITARLAKSLQMVHNLAPQYQDAMREQVKRLAAHELSKDARDIVTRILE